MTTTNDTRGSFTPLNTTGGHPLHLAVYLSPEVAARVGYPRSGRIYVPVTQGMADYIRVNYPAGAGALFSAIYDHNAPQGAVGVYGPDGRITHVTLDAPPTAASIVDGLCVNANAVADAFDRATATLAAAPHAGGKRYTVRVHRGGMDVAPADIVPSAPLGTYTIEVSTVSQPSGVDAARDLLTRLPVECLPPEARAALKTMRAVDDTALPTLAVDTLALVARYGLGDGATDAHLARFKVVVPYHIILRDDCDALRALHHRTGAAAGRIRDAAEAHAKADREAREAAAEARRAGMVAALRAFALTVPELAPGAEDGYEMGPGVADLIAQRVEDAADGIDGVTTTRTVRMGGPGWDDTDPPEARANPKAAAVRARRALVEACNAIASSLPPGIRLDVSPVGRVHDHDANTSRTGITVLVTGECPGVPERLVVAFCE